MTNVPDTALQTLGSRIDTLEMRVTYQDDVIEKLNTVIVEQWSKFDHLLGRLERLENRVRETQDNAGQGGYDEPPPPHY
jgi:SlyX protein